MMSDEQFEVEVTYDGDGLIAFTVIGHENVSLALSMPRDDEDADAFDWLAGSATQVVVAGLTRIVDEVEAAKVG